MDNKNGDAVVVVDPANPVNADGANPTLGNPVGDGSAVAADPAQNVNSANSIDGAGAANGDDSQQPVEPKKENHDTRRMKKFIDKAAQLEAENLALKAQINGGQKPVKSIDEEKPRRDMFVSDEEFIDASVNYRVAKAVPEIQKTISERTIRSQAENTFQRREIEVRKSTPDYDEVIADASDVMIPPIVADAIMTSDIGPDLRYFLAKNPERAQSLNGLPPASAARELGRIEAEIVAENNKKPVVKVSGAPAPIRPVKSDGGAVVETDLEKMPTEEFFKRRNEQRKKLGKTF